MLDDSAWCHGTPNRISQVGKKSSDSSDSATKDSSLQRSRSHSFDNLVDLKKGLKRSLSRQNATTIDEITIANSRPTTPTSGKVHRGGDIRKLPADSKESVQNKTTGTIFSHRQYQNICIACVIAVLLLLLLLKYNYSWSSSPLCTIVPQRTKWMENVNIFSAGGMVFNLFSQSNRLSLSTFRENGDIGTKGSYIASLCLTLIATMTSLTLLFDNWGGYCIDAFGFVTPAALWPDWLLSVPLMVFVVASVDDKPYLSPDDWKGIFSTMIMLFTGIVNNLQHNLYIASAVLLLTFFCIPPLTDFLQATRRDLNTLMKKIQANERKKGHNQRKLLLASRKVTLAMCLEALMLVYPVTYTLCGLGFISNDSFSCLLPFFSAIGKLIFVSFCLNAHLEVSHPAIALIDAENFGNTSRRAFIRYVFHEVRVPLNSIALGIQILANHCTDLDKSMLDTLCMIRDAVNFMGDTLNDVMALQKVEEGKLELIFKSFSIYDLFQNIQDTFIEISATSDVLLETSVDSNMPSRLIGDKFRIRHVLSNLISNAIKFSKPGSTVRLTVESEGPVDKSMLPKVVENGLAKAIKFQVIDEGCGIAQTEQDMDIFTPFRKLKDGELTAARGSGLGLAISREIVHMHGGQISYVSVVGSGTTFSVIIPLELATSSLSTSQSIESTPQSSTFPSFSNSTSAGDAPSTNNAHPLTVMGGLGISPMHALRVQATPRRWRTMSMDSAADRQDSRSIVSSHSYGLSKDSSDGTSNSSSPSKSLDSARSVEATSLKPQSNNGTGNENASFLEHRYGYPLGQRYYSTLKKSTSASKAQALLLREDADAVNPDAVQLSPRVPQHSRSFSLSRSDSLSRKRSSGSISPLPEGLMETVEETTFSDSDEAPRLPVKSASTDGTGGAESSMRSWRAETKIDIPRLEMNGLATTPSKPLKSCLANRSPANADHQVRVDEQKRISALKVLVVDDVASNRKLLALLMQQKGIRNIDFAEDGQQALSTVALKEKSPEGAYDLIFMDNTMPHMTGIDASLHLRQSRFANLIVGITGNAMDDELDDFLKSGADWVLTKPMRPNILDLLIRFIIKNGVLSREYHKLDIRDQELQWVR